MAHSQTVDEKNTSNNSTRYIAPSHRVNGTVYVNRIHVLVRWGWLALPLGLSLLTEFLLIATIMETRRQRVGMWKDSPLAMLLHSEWKANFKPQDVAGRTADELEREVKGLCAGFEEYKVPLGDVKRRIVIRSQ